MRRLTHAPIRRRLARLRRREPAVPAALAVRGVTGIDLRMMERALWLARRAAARGEVPVGAVVYRGRRIIADGSNEREATADPTAHAELLAIARAGRRLGTWRLDDCSLAVTLEPCPMCAGAIVNARLGRLLYGALDPKAGACESLYRIPEDERLNHTVTVIGGVLQAACAEPLTSFFRSRRVRGGVAGLSPAGEARS